VAGTHTARAWERYASAAGVVFVVALLAEAVISAAIPINQNDSAAKIATELAQHRERLLVAAYLSAVYAVAFVVYLCRLHQLLRARSAQASLLGSLVLIGGVLSSRCMPSAMSGSTACSAESSRPTVPNTTRASRTRCT
jgi:DMSO reductase anchor subunit